jgi:mRNA interferase RelE/StbE
MTEWKIKASGEFKKKFKDLTKKNKPLRERILKSIEEKLKENPYVGKPLSYDLAGLRSLRVGKYRVIYKIDEKNKIIWLVTVGHREKVY